MEEVKKEKKERSIKRGEKNGKWNSDNSSGSISSSFVSFIKTRRRRKWHIAFCVQFRDRHEHVMYVCV